MSLSYRTVVDEKRMSKEVRDMFASIARRYDAGNDVLSFGIHRLWRSRLVRAARLQEASTVLDICTGTGDLAFALQDALGARGSVYGLDFVQDMLEIAVRKQGARSGKPPVSFFRGDALAIPLAENSVDIITVAFGIRNVDSVQRCLSEMRRVLRPGGQLLVLEFGQATLPVFRTIYNWYSAHVMPLLGKLVTGNRAAYEYLPKTSLAFPCREAFLRELDQAGFSSAEYLSLMGGIAYIYQARLAAKPPAQQTDEGSLNAGNI
jgi:demethylmenaquinone methyltransferase/2-methoxy-6-polyprenyl-1,4-benzoquinol methylase